VHLYPKKMKRITRRRRKKKKIHVNHQRGRGVGNQFGSSREKKKEKKKTLVGHLKNVGKKKKNLKTKLDVEGTSKARWGVETSVGGRQAPMASRKCKGSTQNKVSITLRSQKRKPNVMLPVKLAKSNLRKKSNRRAGKRVAWWGVGKHGLVRKSDAVPN